MRSVRAIGGEFYVDGDSALWHGSTLLLEPNEAMETEKAFYIPDIDAVLTNKGNLAPFGTYGMLFSKDGAILTSRRYDSESPFMSITQPMVLEAAPVFLVSCDNMEKNAVFVRKKGDEYKWAFMFPQDIHSIHIDEYAQILYVKKPKVGRKRDSEIVFSYKHFKYFPKLYEYRVNFTEPDGTEKFIGIRAGDDEHAKETARKMFLSKGFVGSELVSIKRT